jgi:DNA polymerase-1
MKGPTFRHELFDKYKAHRPPTPDDLVSQFVRVKELVKAFNIPLFEIQKYEADDVLGTLSRQASECGIDSIIVTGDADAMQSYPVSGCSFPKDGKALQRHITFRMKPHDWRD